MFNPSLGLPGISVPTEFCHVISEERQYPTSHPRQFGSVFGPADYSWRSPEGFGRQNLAAHVLVKFRCVSVAK